MGRETLLTILLLLFGGLAAQPLAAWPWRQAGGVTPAIAERRAWRRIWLPLVPTLVVAAWLCGWALRQPDPVRGHVDRALLVAACLPFALVAIRAAARSLRALVREPVPLPVCTAGLLQPRVVFSPFFARTLDDAQIRAAWEHEQAHVRHRDPLRIWLAQIATDLQWPWPWARERFDAWLQVLEWARDDEARSRGASGVDLAAAVLATARQFAPGGRQAAPDAALAGDAGSLQLRIGRLLAPLPVGGASKARAGSGDRVAAAAAGALVVTAIVLVVASGALYGNAVLHPFLTWTWTV